MDCVYVLAMKDGLISFTEVKTESPSGSHKLCNVHLSEEMRDGQKAF